MSIITENTHCGVTCKKSEYRPDPAEFSVKDLLGRDSIVSDTTEASRMISGKTVLVTGGGGSIGSELCRQIASFDPSGLIIYDIYENNAFYVYNELKTAYPETDIKLIIGSVRDSRRLEQVFSEFCPHIVFHAAAHKHVPLLEDNPSEAIKNNVFGTYKTAYASLKHGVERFVLISTDKAVNPTSIMGASKLLCEMIVTLFDTCIKQKKCEILPYISSHNSGEENLFCPENSCKTGFLCVRFGNVLASNGSVVPVFSEQIKAGGPVKVTHPDIMRYFMTIPEAVSLVLTAGAKASGGEIYVLDMGEPVKIDTLARNLIRLSGFEPDKDIKIEYTGLRPGEKLFEELLTPEECVGKTSDSHIFIGRSEALIPEVFLKSLTELFNAAQGDASLIKPMLKSILPTYKPVDNK